jgi:hypothetical protein
MAWELDVVFRHNNVKATAWVFDLNKLENLHVVLLNFLSKSVGTDVDNIYIWVLHTKDSRDLGVFLLFELFNAQSSDLADTITVDVDFNSFCSFHLRPAFLELILHVSPHVERLDSKSCDFILCALFELVQTVLALDYSGPFHQMCELVIGR